VFTKTSFARSLTSEPAEDTILIIVVGCKKGLFSQGEQAMDSGKDSLLWHFKWHILIIVGTLAGVVLLALFTDIFEKSDKVRQLVWLLGALIFLAALLATLSRVSNIASTLSENSSRFQEATKALEDICTGLAQINHSTRISETAKAIAFREDDKQSLSDAVFEKLKQQDFRAAYDIIDEISKRSEYEELAVELRQQADKYRVSTEQERTEQTITYIESLLDAGRWASASAQIESMIKAHPESEKAKALRYKLVEMKERRKRMLLASWDEAVKHQETDRSLEILKELDMYLTPNEALALQEAARDAFRTKLHNLGVRFSLAVSERQWTSALEIGRQIIQDFPNSRMSVEIRDKLDVLQQNVQLQQT
jgi:hypothetical protein